MSGSGWLTGWANELDGDLGCGHRSRDTRCHNNIVKCCGGVTPLDAIYIFHYFPPEPNSVILANNIYQQIDTSYPRLLILDKAFLAFSY